MSQYPVVWDEKSRTLTLRDETDRPAKEAISQVYAPVDGEIPTNVNPPQVGQHLENLARQRNVEWRYVTIKNNTKNPRLDVLEKKGDKFEPEAELGDEAGETEISEPTAPMEPPVEPPKEEPAPVVKLANADAKEKKSTPAKA